MSCRAKIIEFQCLNSWRAELDTEHRPLVVTNGCFDVLHAGHVSYLEAARSNGKTLLVGVNDDASVHALKGEGRPFNCECDRVLVVAALQAVTAVCLFSGVSAADFIRAAKPDIYVKGGDYTLESLNVEERVVLEQLGSIVSIIPALHGRSTTNLLKKMC